MDKRPGNAKIMVLGFDGASWNILKTMMEKGHLPHFSYLMKNGVSGNLKSTVPPLSGPAWASFATGKNPGKHGIYDFFRNVPKEYATTLINSSFFPTKTLWEVLSEKGKKVAVSMPNVIIGRQLQEGDILYSHITENEFRTYKEYKQHLSDEEKEILREIAEMMRTDNPVWGV